MGVVIGGCVARPDAGSYLLRGYHAISKTALLIHTVKIFGELPVEHKIHNSLLPWVQINGAVFAVGVEVQLNAGAIGELFTCQLSV